MHRLIAVAAVLVLSLPARSEPQQALKLPTLFSDGVVLQQELACPVWGWAAPGEEVTVSVAGQKKSAKAADDGKWLLKLDPMKAGGPHEMSVAGKTTIAIKDVWVGEVWICSGQSNMEWHVNSSANPAEEKASANWPKIRMFTVPRKPMETPQAECGGSWEIAVGDKIGRFSAVGYFFGRELHKALDVPVGLIHTSWGGTPAEVWTSRRAFEANPTLKPISDAWPARAKAFEEAAAKHKEAAEKAKAEGKPAPRAPGKPWQPSVLYNGMIAPLIPYGIRGAIWYQGESNASQAKLYQTLFPAMIQNWRDDWGQGDFPFGFVQLANFMKRQEQPSESAWAELREAQLKTLSLKNTGQAVIIDIGDAADIHPKNKQDVGRRLAYWAQAKVYGKDVVYSGPVYKAMKADGASIRLSFDHVGGGLVAKGDKLVGFAVAGEDRKFVWADAKIEGAEVVVSAAGVDKPVAVRYAWADNPDCNLYNKEGIPASPFRTDDWPRGK
jgi:sialate O-acetylesterase